MDVTIYFIYIFATVPYNSVQLLSSFEAKITERNFSRYGWGNGHKRTLEAGVERKPTNKWRYRGGPNGGSSGFRTQKEPLDNVKQNPDWTGKV